MKKQKIILMEFLNECNEWIWYGIYTNGTPRQALKNYFEEMGIGHENERAVITEDKSGIFYLKEGNARAFYVDVTNLK